MISNGVGAVSAEEVLRQWLWNLKAFQQDRLGARADAERNFSLPYVNLIFVQLTSLSWI